MISDIDYYLGLETPPSTPTINLRQHRRALPDIPACADAPACCWPPNHRPDMRGMGAPAEGLPSDLVPWSMAGWKLMLVNSHDVQMLPACEHPAREEELRTFLNDIHVQRRLELTLEAWIDLQAQLDVMDASTRLPIDGTTDACATAVQQDGLALASVPSDIKSPEMCMAAVKRNGLALKFVPAHFKTKELCLEAVKQNARALEYVPDEMTTPTFCLEAVKQNARALDFVPETVRTENFCLDAVRTEPRSFACYRCPKTPELCMEAVKRDGRLLRWMPDPLRTRELCITAYRQNPAAIVDVPARFRRTTS